MSNGIKVIGIAIPEVGYKETPANSNKTKYGTWFGLNGVAWCGIFVSWCYAQANLQLPNIGFSKGYAGCQSAVAYFKKSGEVTKDPQIGDIVFFDWNGDGRFDHTGLLHGWTDDNKTTFKTVEGNTSLTNQSNGGQVMTRTRGLTKGVLFVHPKVLG